MAKKPTTSKKTTASKETVEKPSAEALEANKKLAQHLDGLHEFYKASNKPELAEFVDTAMEKIRGFEDSVKHSHFVQECEKIYEEFEDTKDKNFVHCLTLAGQIIGHLNECLTIKA